jgi:hypothetical protein
VREGLDLLARFFALFDGTKPVFRQREAESTRGGVESAPGDTPRARLVRVPSSTLKPEQGANGNSVIGVLKPNRFACHA